MLRTHTLTATGILTIALAVSPVMASAQTTNNGHDARPSAPPVRQNPQNSGNRQTAPVAQGPGQHWPTPVPPRPMPVPPHAVPPHARTRVVCRWIPVYGYNRFSDDWNWNHSWSSSQRPHYRRVCRTVRF